MDSEEHSERSEASTAAHIHEYKYVSRCLAMYPERPKQIFAFLCGLHCFFFLLFILLAITVGSSFLPFTTDLPLYLREDQAKMREDALAAGIAGAQESFAAPSVRQLQQSISTANEGAGRLELSLLYITDGNIFAPENLKLIKEVEDRIRSASDYPKYCLKDWPASLLSVALNNSVVEENNRSPPGCAPAKTAMQACVPSSDPPTCAPITSTPVGLLECNVIGGCPIVDLGVDADFVDSKVQQYAQAPNPFYEYADSSFGEGNMVSKGLRSVFVFALPLEGYSSIDDRYEDQESELETFIFDEFHSYLMDKQAEFMDLDNPMELWWSGFGMTGIYIQSILPGDAANAVFSFIFVWMYMTLLTKSFFLSSMGMGQIFMSFFPSYFMYYAVFQQRYFGMFNVLSIFIILGIGADDVFVALDTWNQAGVEAGRRTEDMHNRLYIYWMRSARAMLVTSTTTAASFFASATSSFPAISTFGIFAALLVVTNYCSVIIYYPAVITFHAMFLADKRWCCSRFKKKGTVVEEIVRDDESSKAVTATTLDGDEVFMDENEPEGMKDVSSFHSDDEENEYAGRTERFFALKFAPFINRCRFIIVFVFLVLFVVAIIQAVQLRPDAEAPQLLPSGNNYQEFPSVLIDNFLRGPSDRSLRQRIVFGFADPPIDRAGTSATNLTDFGTPIYADWNFADSAQCIVSICEDLQEANTDLDLGGGPLYPASCMILALRDWVNANKPAGEWEAAIVRPPTAASMTNLSSLAIDFMSAERNIETWRKYFGTADTGERLRSILFHYVEVQLISTFEQEYTRGVDLYNRWEEWLINKKSQPICESTPMFQYASGSAYFFVQKVLLKEAIQGIAISLSFALVILLIATHNVIIGLLAALTIACIVLCVLASVHTLGWKLGLLETINLVMVPGMAVDFVAHFAEGFVESHATTRLRRVQTMLAEVGISVVSGAFSTLGATVFLFLATIAFFGKFGLLIFFTILFSLIWAMFFFPAVVCICGPNGSTGDILALCTKKKAGAEVDSKMSVLPIKENLGDEDSNSKSG